MLIDGNWEAVGLVVTAVIGRDDQERILAHVSFRHCVQCSGQRRVGARDLRKVGLAHPALRMTRAVGFAEMQEDQSKVVLPNRVRAFVGDVVDIPRDATNIRFAFRAEVAELALVHEEARRHAVFLCDVEDRRVLDAPLDGCVDQHAVRQDGEARHHRRVIRQRHGRDFGETGRLVAPAVDEALQRRRDVGGDGVGAKTVETDDHDARVGIGIGRGGDGRLLWIGDTLHPADRRFPRLGFRFSTQHDGGGARPVRFCAGCGRRITGPARMRFGL